jgi:predicted PurR-regulated permease PerM
MQRVEIPYLPSRQLVLWTLGVMAVLGCFWLLIRFQDAVLVLLTAVILSMAMRPSVIWLEKRGIVKPIGILIIFVVVGLLLGLLLWYALLVLAEDGTAMLQSLSEGYQLLLQSLRKLPNILTRRLLLVLPNDLPMLGDSLMVIGGGDATLTDTAGPGRRRVVGVVQLIVIATLTFYWTLEGERIKQAAFLLIPMPKRSDTRQLVKEMETKVSVYLLGQGLLCVIVGALAFIAYGLIGLPHALLLAIFAGLLEAVPIAGPFLGAVPAIFVGLTVSPLAALWVILASGIIQQLENSLLLPRVMNKTIGVRPLVTLMALLAFGSSFGILGALIALPLAAIIQLLLDRHLLAPASLDPADPGRDRLSVLRHEANQLVQDVRNQVRQKEGVPSAATDALEDELEAIALDLVNFLATQVEGTR